ncbi:MAG: hypothetical protein NW206_07700 [Hyphomonadaceae bacterium]|nr:hypothetical protein [Hyphomonadaceae bacterium]
MSVLLATSVIRGSQQGDSHGGAFLIDLAARSVRQVLDWRAFDIDWQGRGWDRGLRGVAFGDEDVFLAASDELFVFDRDFSPIASYRNAYLKHAHEMARFGDMLFIVSTGFDCVLGFDLGKRAFTWGLALTGEGQAIRGRRFDPQSTGGPAALNVFHLNSVSANQRGLYIAGLRTPGLLRYAGEALSLRATLPAGAHNAQPFRDGIIFNDTRADVVRFVSPSRQRTFHVPHYPDDKLTHTDLDDSRIARQGFGRGLCAVEDGLIAAGSSPATVSLHDVDDNRSIAVITLSLDVRTSIHGLALWPW